MPPLKTKALARSALVRFVRGALPLALIPLALAAGTAASPPPELETKLALVDNSPAAGRTSLSLQAIGAQSRHNYGSFSLVRLTAEQEDVLREAGYNVRILEDADRIGLGPYSFRIPEGPSGLPDDLRWREGPGVYDTWLIRFIGPPADAWLARLRELGGEVLTPVPSFTYLTKIPLQRRQEIAALPFVEWMGPYQPAFKLSPELVELHRQGALPDTVQELSVLVYRWADVDGTLNRIRGMQGEVLQRSRFDFYELATVRLPARLVPDLARMPEIYALELTPEPKLEDESSTQILAGQVSSGIPFQPALGQPSYGDWLAARNLDGSNVTIGYVDEGILNNDPTAHLSGRVNETACGTAGQTGSGHGHFGASNAGGACVHPGEAGTGFKWGLGVAPSVNFINLPALNSNGNCFTNVSDSAALSRLTVTSAGPANGVPGSIQNNSWGSGRGDTTEDVSYQSLERTYDVLARDADSVAAGNQPLVTCFSAGNEGNSTPGAPGPTGQLDAAATLTRPHSAKNILTTGSSSVYRTSAGASNIGDRSYFSSQGPAMDGRIKPDFLAPGGAAGNFSALSSALLPGATVGSSVGDGLHGISAGTSFASPQTAGGAALLAQWWQRFASVSPSPAMVKALLINSARDMQGGNTPDFIPNRHEGWGRWNLGNIIEAGTPTVIAAPPLLRKTSGLGAIYLDQGVVFGNTGAQYQLRLIPSDVTKPLRATLVWTDAPGASGACPALVNDLDLEIVQNGKIVLKGNALSDGTSVDAGPPDQRNNIEQIIQPNPSGFYTLTVKAVTLAGDGIPGNADTTDQDFALVVTNALIYTGPILAAGSIVPTDVCSGTGSGGNAVIDPGESAVFSLPLVNSGGASATSVSGSLVSLTPGVTVLDGASSYADIPAGVTGNPNAGDTLSVLVGDTVPCGTGVDLIFNVSTTQGSFPVPVHLDVGSKTIATQNLTGATGAVNNDINNPSVFTTPSASAGTVRSVGVDVNVSNPTSGRGSAYLFGDYILELVSPQGTPVTLHLNPLPCSSLNTSYPTARLAQIGTLQTFKGQDAGGSWELRVTSRNNSVCSGGGPSGPCSSATVNSWTLHVTRESAPSCNTCIAAAPPEVSAPGSATPLMLGYDAANGIISFTWQNLGAQVDFYRLYQGSIGSLAGTGVTSSNTSPVLCGIATAGTSLVPASGNLFFLVAGQKASAIGPLGNATDPGTYPRSASQTCP